MIHLKFFAWVCLLLISSAAVADEKTPAPAAAPKPTQEELEKQFAETMSGSVMIGNFTTTGQPADTPLKEDGYAIDRVSKRPNGKWLFESTMKSGDREVKMPLVLDVKWAGDTPVITLTDFGIPGMGTFTARVMIFRGQYAGTWSAGDHGGLMFGRVEKQTAENKSKGTGFLIPIQPGK